MENHEEIFNKIYKENIWGGSGGGSNPENCKLWIQFIRVFIKENNIKSVVDFGCGDWQHSPLINYTELNVQYLGVECVPSLVTENTNKFSNENIQFQLINNYKDLNYKKDLLIVKDVLMHWKTESIVEFLDKQLIRYKHIILSNIIENADRKDSSEPSVSPIGLSSEFYPLNKYKITLSFIDDTNPLDLKEIIIISND